MGLTYEEKKKIADDYIGSLTDGNASWDTLPDINSLHDAETEQHVRELCDARLEDEGFPFDEFGDE